MDEKLRKLAKTKGTNRWTILSTLCTIWWYSMIGTYELSCLFIFSDNANKLFNSELCLWCLANSWHIFFLDNLADFIGFCCSLAVFAGRREYGKHWFYSNGRIIDFHDDTHDRDIWDLSMINYRWISNSDLRLISQRNFPHSISENLTSFQFLIVHRYYRQERASGDRIETPDAVFLLQYEYYLRNKNRNQNQSNTRRCPAFLFHLYNFRIKRIQLSRISNTILRV